LVDVAILDTDGTPVGVFAGDGRGDFAPLRAAEAGVRPRRAVVNDFNGDGALDLAILDDGGLSFLAGDGSGGFKAPQRIQRNANLRAIATADFNGDGAADLAVI